MSATPCINLSQSCQCHTGMEELMQQSKKKKHFEGKIIICLISGLAAVSKKLQKEMSLQIQSILNSRDKERNDKYK